MCIHKKRFAALLLGVMLLGCLTLTSCRRQNDQPDDLSRPPQQDAASDAASDAGAALAPDAAPDPDGDILTLATDVNLRLSSYTDDGLYFMSTEKMMETASNIKYIDFATKQQIFLCSAPNCTHDTAACASYVEGGGYLYVAYSHLYVVNPFSSIQVRDLDGSNARTILTLADGEELTFGALAADKNHLYCIRQRYLEDEDRLEKLLLSVDAQTGETRTVYTMQPSDFFVGSCGRWLLLRDLSHNDLRTFAIDTEGEAVDGLHFPPPFTTEDAWEYVTDQGLIYHITFHPCNMTEWDIRSGETRVIVEDFPAENYGATWLGAPLDGYLPIATRTLTGEDSFVEHAYLLNLETGEYAIHPLQYEGSDEKTHHIYPLGKGQGMYVVRSGERVENYWSNNPRLPGNQEAVVYIYSLISTEDFLRGEPTYIETTEVG